MASVERSLRIIRGATLGTVVLAGAAFYVDGTIKSNNLKDEIDSTRINPALSFKASEDRVDMLASQRRDEINKALFSGVGALASGAVVLYYSVRRRQNS